MVNEAPGLSAKIIRIAKSLLPVLDSGSSDSSITPPRLQPAPPEHNMITVQRLTAWLFPDRRPEREKTREREFIRVANSLKSLRVTLEGGMFIDPKS